MKIIFKKSVNVVMIVYFMMGLNIDHEIGKAVAIINDDTFDENKLRNSYHIGVILQYNYLFNIMKITIEYPKIESYLKDLLMNFSVDGLETPNFAYNEGFVFGMMDATVGISINAFEMVINHGININHTNQNGSTLLHILFCSNKISARHNDIINLFIKYGANLNILNIANQTILDYITAYPSLYEELKMCIITLVDNGAKTSKPSKNNILNFIESCRCNNIKPAIKK